MTMTQNLLCKIGFDMFTMVSIMDTFALVSQLLAGFVIFVTLWGFLPVDYWWVRGVDFPRIQFITLGFSGLLGLGLTLLYADNPVYHSGTGYPADVSLWLLAGLVLAQGYQLRMVLPYTRLWKKRSTGCKP